MMNIDVSFLEGGLQDCLICGNFGDMQMSAIWMYLATD
jgi:hypothetical protein